MPPEDRDNAYLWDLLDAAKAALSYVSGIPKEHAVADEMRMSAFERKLEIIGEAARRVSEEFARAHPEIPDRAAQRTRTQLW